jgi:hypothetical protein
MKENVGIGLIISKKKLQLQQILSPFGPGPAFRAAFVSPHRRARRASNDVEAANFEREHLHFPHLASVINRTAR